MLQQKLPFLTAISTLLLLTVSCTSSPPQQSTPASPAPSPATQATSAPAQLAPVQKVRDKVNDAQQKEADRQKETPENP